ncbi:MAG: thermonuclease family protein [Burkholderiaceae bacterium]
MRFQILFVALLCLAASAAHAATLNTKGTVISIADGDTFDARISGGRVIRVRFGGIDTPEHGQTHSWRSRQALRELIRGKTVDLNCYKQDPRGRQVCRVFVGGQDVGLQMVARGAAWHFKAFAKEQTVEDRQRYARAEDAARAAKRGIWALANPMPPWECRDRLQEAKLCR